MGDKRNRWRGESVLRHDEPQVMCRHVESPIAHLNITLYVNCIRIIKKKKE